MATYELERARADEFFSKELKRFDRPAPANALNKSNTPEPTTPVADVVIDITQDTAVVHPKPEPQPAMPSESKPDWPQAESNAPTVNSFEEGIKGVIWGNTPDEQSTRHHPQSRATRRHQNQPEPSHRRRPRLRRGHIESQPNVPPQPVMHEKVSRVGRFLHKVGETAFKLEGVYYQKREKILKVGAVAVFGLVAASGVIGVRAINQNNTTDMEKISASPTTTTSVFEAPTSTSTLVINTTTSNRPTPAPAATRHQLTPDEQNFNTMRNTVDAYRAAHPAASEAEVNDWMSRTLQYATQLELAKTAQS
jgi:hypothetical protein